MSNQKNISLIIPGYNAANHIGELINTVHAEISDRLLEIIVVDDGSKDDTWKVISNCQKSISCLRGIRFASNAGQHNATMCGLIHANGEIIITMDDDFRHDPLTLKRLIEEHESNQFDFSYGINVNNTSKSGRKLMSNGIKASTKYFSSHSFGEGSSFRIINRSILDELKSNVSRNVFIDEIIHWYTTNIGVVYLDNKVVKRKSRYTNIRLFKMYTDIVHNYAEWPLKLMVRFGALFSVISAILSVRYIIRRINGVVDVEGFTTLIVAILFSSSLIILSLGVIGLYVFKLYHIRSGKPNYIIKETI